MSTITTTPAAPSANGVHVARAAQPDLADLQALQRLADKYPWMFNGMDPRDQKTVGEIVPLYLDAAGEELDAAALADRRRVLGKFAEAFGEWPVREMTPLVARQWIKSQRRWKSPWMRSGVLAAIMRLFNWAVEMRLIRENPAKGAHFREEKKPGRDMTPQEFQAALRGSDPCYRRLLVGFRQTGARIDELCRLAWPNVDWQKGAALLHDHKTRKKTHRPRRLMLSDCMLKLLRWLERNPYDSAGQELRRILEAQPGRMMKVKDLVARMHAKGYTYRRMFCARRALGVIHRRMAPQAITGCRHCGKRATKFRRGLCLTCYRDVATRDRFRTMAPWENGYYIYELPAGAARASKPSDRVFLNQRGTPWTRFSVAGRFRRLRPRAGLPKDCRPYGVRHFFFTHAVKRGTNLKALAELGGHKDTRMLDRVYVHVSEDLEFLRGALHQALSSDPGNGAAPLVVSGQEPEVSSNNGATAAVAAQVSAEMQAFTERLLVRLATLQDELARAARAEVPAPPSVDQKSTEAPSRKLNAAEKIAYEAAAWARKSNPELVTDVDVFKWLAGQDRYRGQLPPTAATFRRYLVCSRRALDGCSKREARRKELEIEPRPAVKSRSRRPAG
jgi:integrase